MSTSSGRCLTPHLPGLYAASDVFVMPNREEGVDFEGFGIVFLEAAATGRPAIGGRSGGVSEAVTDSETGVLVGGREVMELAQAMRRLATSAETRASMGAAGRARVLRSFTWDHGAALLEDGPSALYRRRSSRRRLLSPDSASSGIRLTRHLKSYQRQTLGAARE